MRSRFGLLCGACVVLVGVLAGPVRGQILLGNFATYTEDFQNTNVFNPTNPFTGAGFRPDPAAGQLDSDMWIVRGLTVGSMLFGGTATGAGFAQGQSSGGVSAGGVYAFNVGGGNIALGLQPTGSDSAAGLAFYVQVANQTGGPVAGFTVEYERLVRNDQALSNQFNFGYAVRSGPELNPSLFPYTSVSDYTSPTTADALGWQSMTVSQTIDAPMTNGEWVYFRWQLARLDSDGGPRDEFGIGSFRITLTPVPEPAGVLLTCAAGAAGLGLARRVRPRPT